MEIQLELQAGYWWLGEVLRRLDRPAEAEQALRRSTALTEELIAESSEPPADQYRHLGVTGEVLSLVLNDLGRKQESRQLSQERVSRMQVLEDSRLTAAQRQLLLADSYYWLGHGHLMNGRLNDAQPAFQQAVELWDQAASESPDVYNARRDLARGHLLIAAARERNAGAEDARQSFRDASELLKAPWRMLPRIPIGGWRWRSPMSISESSSWPTPRGRCKLTRFTPGS
jgi:hypothetical protein